LEIPRRLQCIGVVLNCAQRISDVLSCCSFFDVTSTWHSDSEEASAGVLMWRLSVELRLEQAFSERAERIASRSGGALLFLLAAYVMMAAVWHPWTGTGKNFHGRASSSRPWQFPRCVG
jgi:hypothetical protein